MDDLLSEFLTETAENLSVLDVELVQLERNPNNPELLRNIFRLVHTIKGTCGFLGLPRLEAVAHAGENILGKFRDGELVVTPQAVSLILAALDRIKLIVAQLEATEAEPAGDDSELIAQLNAMADGRPVEIAAPAPVPAPAPAPAPAIAIEDIASGTSLSLDELDAIFAAAPGPVEVAAPAPAPAPVEAPKPIAAAVAPVAAPKAPEAKPAAAAPAPAADGGHESAVAAQSIRVNVDLLEKLMTTVSELVLTRNQLMQILRGQKDSAFAAPLQRLNQVTSELQEDVMKTRMQPIGNAWAKLPRVVRDLGHELGKRIELQMVGAETELDRQVLDLIKDPLTHMVRNSADHGLEGPAERIGAGKPEVGTIRLNAYHEGGHIIIEIGDDGRGLNIDRIKQKAVASGLATEAEVEGMSDTQVAQFIFRAGFSTAAAVTAVSGRGVGMDVVRTNIERIGGTIELATKSGKGSTFTVKIPLTLAIVSALIVDCGGERFAIPQISVVELVRAGRDSEHSIERLNGTPVLRLRDRLLPLAALRSLLKLDDGASAGPSEDEDHFIIVTQVGAATFGIIVDRVFDTEEIVVKPVAPILRDIPLYSGNTILGDGSVIMILDPNGLSGMIGDLGHGAAEDRETQRQRSIRSSNEKTTLLVFRAGEGAPKAVPLSLVARLEDFETSAIETSNGQPVIQYRDRLMPLLPLIGTHWQPRGERQPVLVFADGERAMGLLVDEILDIVEERLQVQLVADHHGYVGTAVIAGRSTEVVDTGWYVTQASRDWFGRHDESFGEPSVAKRLLLVDDSPFFRNLLQPLLAAAGYDVTTADSGEAALAMAQQGEQFDVIVSDIEMTGMSGFALAQTIRTETGWRDVPMVALSSHATPRDYNRGRESGFTDYVPKLDREALLNTLSQTLAEHRGAA